MPPAPSGSRADADSDCAQYLVYLGWLIIELVFVVVYIIETKGTHPPPLLSSPLLSPPTPGRSAHDTSKHTGRTLEETAALFDGEQSPQALMQTGGEAATMSRHVAPHRMSRPGIWIEEEKSTVTDVVEMRDSASRRVSDRTMSQTMSMSRYDDGHSIDSQSRICEAL